MTKMKLTILAAAMFMMSMAQAGTPTTCVGEVPGVMNCTTVGVPGPSPTPIPPPTPTPVPIDRFEGCPENAVTIDRQWGNLKIITNNWGTFNHNVMSIRIDVPLDWTPGTRTFTSSWAEYVDAGTTRQAILSHKACDFSDANAVRTPTGTVLRTSGNWNQFSFRYSLSGDTRAAAFKPGGTYYINVVNRYSDGTASCGGSCGMVGGLPK